MRLTLYRLALAVGELDVDALQAKMSRRRLMEWLAFYRIDPWGEQRADLRMGVLASTMIQLGAKPSSQAPKPIDFLLYPETGPASQTQSIEQQKAFARMMHEAFKKRD